MFKRTLALTLVVTIGLGVFPPTAAVAAPTTAAGGTAAVGFRTRIIRWLSKHAPGGGPSHGDVIPNINQWMNPKGLRGAGKPRPDDSLRSLTYDALSQGECRDALHLSRLTNDADADAVALRRLPSIALANIDMTEPWHGLYEGMAAACLAAFHGREDLWEVAGSRLEAVHGSAEDCQDRGVLTILREMVEIHRKDPATKFFQGRDGASFCVAGFEDRISG